MNTSIENIVLDTEFTKKKKKKVFEQLTLSSAHHRHGRQKMSIPECDLTGRRVLGDAPQAFKMWT